MFCSYAMRGLLAAVTCSCCLTAFAAEEGRKKPDPEKFFQKRDSNGDGSLSFEEFKAGMPEKAAAKADVRFKKLDTNGDGKISLDEFKAGMKDRPNKKKKKP